MAEFLKKKLLSECKFLCINQVYIYNAISEVKVKEVEVLEEKLVPTSLGN